MRALWIEDPQLIGDSLELLLQVLLPGLTLDKARTVAEANVVALALAGLGVCGDASRHRKG